MILIQLKENQTLNSIIKKKNLLNNFFEKIRPIIEEYVDEKNISAVLNKKNIFIANKKYDITNDLIEVINEKIK